LARARVRSQVERGAGTAKSCFALLDKRHSFRNGPLEPFADGYWDSLLEVGYSPLSAANHLRVMAHLSRWLEREGLGAADFDSGQVGAFLAARRAAGYTCWRSERGLRPLCSYMRSIGAFPESFEIVDPGPFDELLTEFAAYLRVERGITLEVITQRTRVANRFLSALDPPGPEGIGARAVTSFVSAESQERSIGYSKLLVSDLRSFLRFMHVSSRTERDLSGAAPAVAGWRGTSLPSRFDVAEVDALVESCSRTTAVGRRDYAVLKVLSRLGLRAGEVARLRVEDLDWRLGEIVVHGKGGRVDRLTLPVDVGDAIVAYLEHGRPGWPFREVFLKVRAPEGPISSGCVNAIVREAGRRAGVQGAHAHALRHSAASEMLAMGVPLDEIAQVLRHTSTLTTSIYAKLDAEALRSVAEEWPEVSE
jgi:site-specific recombinase XerD